MARRHGENMARQQGRELAEANGHYAAAGASRGVVELRGNDCRCSSYPLAHSHDRDGFEMRRRRNAWNQHSKFEIRER
jgi:hypothetical protein